MSLRGVALEIALRDAVFSQIDAHKTAGDFADNTFTLSKRYLEKEDVQDILVPRVHVQPASLGEMIAGRCEDSLRSTVGIGVGFQGRVDLTDLDAATGVLDVWLLLVEQLIDACRTEGLVADASFQAAQLVGGTNGLSWNLDRLAERSVLETYILVTYIRTV